MHEKNSFKIFILLLQNVIFPASLSLITIDITWISVMLFVKKDILVIMYGILYKLKLREKI